MTIPMTDTADATAALPANPKSVREKAGLDQPAMAALLGMSASGYRAWEAGQRRPGGPAFRLLALIEADPKGTMAKLAAI